MSFPRIVVSGKHDVIEEFNGLTDVPGGMALHPFTIPLPYLFEWVRTYIHTRARATRGVRVVEKNGVAH